MGIAMQEKLKETRILVLESWWLRSLGDTIPQRERSRCDRYQLTTV